jgi:DeoR/GlpR family transcriptional regulator of sugar metabolism
MTDPDAPIPDLLEERGPATVPELAALLGAHPATVERRCTRLQRDGRIRRVTGGAYVSRETDGEPTGSASD